MNCIGLLLGVYFGPAPLVVWRPPNSTHIQTMVFRAPGAAVLNTAAPVLVGAYSGLFDRLPGPPARRGWCRAGHAAEALGQFVFLRCACVIRARLLARSETTLPRRRRPRWLARR